jgi:hypothetical protein
MRAAVSAIALAGLMGLGACASNNDEVADTGYVAPVAASEPAPPAYVPPPEPEPAPPPPPAAETRAGERG